MARDFKTDLNVNGVPVSLSTHTHTSSNSFSTTIGDGSSTSFTVTHALNTRDVIVRCYTNSGVYEDIQPTVTRPSTSQVTLYFLSAPALNSVRVLVQS